MATINRVLGPLEFVDLVDEVDELLKSYHPMGYMEVVEFFKNNLEK